MKKSVLNVDELKKYREKYFIGFFIILILSIILSYAVSNHSRLNVTFSFIVFGIIFILLFGTFDAVITKNNENQNFAIKLVFEILTILILVGQLSVTINQKDIQATQTQILDRTSQSNKADLTLVPSESYRYYLFRLQDLDTSSEIERLPIGIINSGKLLAPSIEIKLIPEDFLGKNNPYAWEIKNLTSLGYKTTDLYFSSRYGNISTGLYNLNFSISCPFCENNYKYNMITICIYSEYPNITNECGGEWQI